MTCGPKNTKFLIPQSPFQRKVSTMEILIKKLALANAVKFKGKANPKALLGGVLQTFPEAKKNMQELVHTIETICDEVNTLSPEEQKTQLLALDPDFDKKAKEAKAERKEERSNLAELPGAIEGKVITRIPPEPSKYNHLGHAMSFLINYLYAKKYHGKSLLRFDDTNPEKAKQEYVDAVFEDVVNFLSIKPDKIKYASENMQKYYEYAETLIEKGNAYVCTCAQEIMSLGRREMKACEHREQSVEENTKLWNKMKAGNFEEGSHVLRLKIDMEHKNAVMRDPVIYRLAYAKHYKQGTKYKVWPMYDFECAIEEGLCGVTHVMRSNEFDTRIELQNYIAKLFGFPAVTYIHYGRYNIIGASTQGREILAQIESGNYLGWDDPRLVTIRALRRRGIVKEAFYELAQKIGLSKTQTNLEYSIIAAINRGLLDSSAKRFFAIQNAVEVTVTGIPNDVTEFTLAYHPTANKGERKLSASTSYYIEKEDNDKINSGQVIRFMDAMNIKKVSETSYEYVSQSYEEYTPFKKMGKLIHFVPKDGQEIHAEILMADVTTKQVICEANIKTISEGDVIQFERTCFARLDKKGEKPLFWYTHD